MTYTPGPTAQQEKEARDAAKAKRARKYRYQPVPLDRINPPPARLGDRPGVKPGDLVVKIQPHGCPRNGTMGHCYIGEAETGKFLGLVSQNSLVPA